jgi:hypothetical protein
MEVSVANGRGAVESMTEIRTGYRPAILPAAFVPAPP